jgi:pimeloyl-ACP methyl ester carboxylesterase
MIKGLETQGSERLAKIRASFHSDFTHRAIETSQGKIAVWDSKPGYNAPTVVFIHGHCTNKEFFEKQLKSPLFEKYRLIALDLPGYGESQPQKTQKRFIIFPDLLARYFQI